MSYIFPAPAQSILPIHGSNALFPIHHIYCVGRNYFDHAIEMGHDPKRENPFFFQKNADNVVHSGADFFYPSKSSEVHHEVELVVALERGGVNIDSFDTAMDSIYGYAVGIDMTRRDLQSELKKSGRPWEISKAFDNSAPCSEIYPVKEIGHPERGYIRLYKNGVVCQNGDLSEMIWKIPEIIICLSEFFSLSAGDLIFTGTPAGVGPVCQGDILFSEIKGVGSFEVSVI